MNTFMLQLEYYLSEYEAVSSLDTSWQMGKSGASFCCLEGKADKMHELGVTRSIVDVVLRNACDQQAKQVLSVSLVIGENAQLGRRMGAALFRPLRKRHPLPKAQNQDPEGTYGFYCNDCGSTFNLPMGSDRHMCCPDCGSENYDMVTGGELLIKEIEIR